MAQCVTARLCREEGYAKKEAKTRKNAAIGEGEKAKRPHSSREKKIYHRREGGERERGAVT